MRFDEGPEPGLPQDVRQARIAMQLVVALDQALALRRQALRQEAEIEVLSPAGESRYPTSYASSATTSIVPPRDERTDFAQCVSITIRDIYLRWTIAAIFIEKK